MSLQRIAWHALAVGTLLLIGVPSNVAVIWIHTRKASRLATNKFPLIFATIDLIAIFLALPLHFVAEFLVHLSADSVLTGVFNSSGIFVMNAYLSTLLMATVDKFYAVYFPFKYRLKRSAILKVAVVLAFGANWLLVLYVELARQLQSEGEMDWTAVFYSVVLVLILLGTTAMFLAIVLKLIHNGRKVRKTEPSATARFVCLLSTSHDSINCY